MLELWKMKADTTWPVCGDSLRGEAGNASISSVLAVVELGLNHSEEITGA